MADNQKGFVAAGSSLLWRRQAVLWWVFVVNFICGVLGAAPAAMQLSRALGNSLAGQKLTKGFDVGIFLELVRLPGVGIMRWGAVSYVFAGLFFLFLLFATGGILETYRLDRKLNTGEFFAASGAFFWRMVRLMLLSIIPFAIVGMLYQLLDKMAERVGDRAIADQVGIFLSWAAILVFLLLALWVRLWFDIAQVRAVAQNETRMRRNVWRAWRITWASLGRLFGGYCCISLVAWIVLVVGLVMWSKLPPTATPVTFLLLELIVLVQLATRLWQLASAMAWYRTHAQVVPTDSVDYTTPPPEEVAEVVSSFEHPLPPGDPGPELPPADA